MLIVDRGTGPPLVLIPGIQGRWEYMRPAIDALSRWYRVITFPIGDEPSSHFAFDPARGFDNYVAQVRDVLDQRGIARAIVCGLSFGGLIALRFAAEYPERTASLILISTPGPTWHLSKRHELYSHLPYLFGPLFVAEVPWRLRRELAAAFPRRAARWRFSASQLWTMVRAPLSLARIARRARLIGRTGALTDCARVALPTLVISGEPDLDYVVSAAASADYVSLIRGTREAVVERTGHLGALTRPDELAAIVRQFVDDRGCQRPDHTEAA